MDDHNDPAGPGGEADRIVDLAYQTTLSPELYDEFVAEWGRFLLARTVGALEALDTRYTVEHLAGHFQRAFQIFERLGRDGQRDASIEELLEEQPGAALAFDAGARLFAWNAAGERMFTLTDGAGVGALPLPDSTRVHLQQRVQEVARLPERTVPEMVRVVDRDEKVLALVLRRTRTADGVLVVANIIATAWHPAADDLLRETFKLTDTELELVRALHQGRTAREIAEERSRSVDTVRTQIKTIQGKTGTNSQATLIRLLTGLAFMCDELASGPPPTTLATQDIVSHCLVLPDGRRMPFADLGPTDGAPWLYLHGLLDTLELVPGLLERLGHSGIRMIAPLRPGFGEADLDPRDDDVTGHGVADLVALLDHLALPQAPLLTHTAGSVFGWRAVADHPERFPALVSVSGGVPMTEEAQLDAMAPRQRVVAMTARYTPRLLPFLVRAGIALIDSGGGELFLRALHRGNAWDRALLEDDEMVERMLAGCRVAAAQGADAFLREAGVVVADWSEVAQRVDVPVLLLHGELDGVVVVDSVRRFARGRNNVELREIARKGQLIMLGAPALVVRAVLDMQGRLAQGQDGGDASAGADWANFSGEF